MKKYGFTLTEVLISLTIIGVIAALTIPTLIKVHEKESIIASLKKTYYTLSNATKLANTEYGYDWPITSSGGLESAKAVHDYYKPFLKIARDCGFNKKGCWSTQKTKTLNNEETSLANDGYFGVGVYTVTLDDGVNLSFDITGDYNKWPLGISETGLYAIIWADVNGNKGPNILGKDVYLFVRRNNGNLVPAGTDYPQQCSKSTSNGLWGGGAYAGASCAFKVLSTGKIDWWN